MTPILDLTSQTFFRDPAAGVQMALDVLPRSLIKRPGVLAAINVLKGDDVVCVPASKECCCLIKCGHAWQPVASRGRINRTLKERTSIDTE